MIQVDRYLVSTMYQILPVLDGTFSVHELQSHSRQLALRYVVCKPKQILTLICQNVTFHTHLVSIMTKIFTPKWLAYYITDEKSMSGKISISGLSSSNASI